MFQSLFIRNFALIENLTIEFGPRLNILSGETGAGKSIVVQALELLLGGRGSVDWIREGEEEAEVAGLFTSEKLGEEWSIRRVLTRSGKHKTFLNDRPTVLSSVEDLGRQLVDLASQHEHQVLLQPSEHLKLLDQYARCDLLLVYQESFARYREAREALEGLQQKAQVTSQQEEFLRFQLRELESAGLKEGEEEELTNERARSKNGVRLGQVVTEVEAGLSSGEETIEQRLASLTRGLEAGAGLDPSLAPLVTELQEASCRIGDVAQALQRYQAGLNCDPERLQEVEDRLALLSQLKRKHGGDLAQLFQKQAELEQALQLLDNFDGELVRRTEELKKLETVLMARARALNERRQEEGVKLSRQVEKELKLLGMVQAKFEVSLQALAVGLQIGKQFFSEEGTVSGEFLLAPNVGEGLRPLSKIASGGELSRILLAVKKVMGASREVPTYVFDEIDVGIGGGIAEVVGKNLAQLAERCQVICVTHLPQVACFGDQHFVIAKRTERGRTKTLVERLGNKEREEEIARMLAGIQVTEKARAHAREMIKNARYN